MPAVIGGATVPFYPVVVPLSAPLPAPLQALVKMLRRKG